MSHDSSLYKNTDMDEGDVTADRGIIPAETAARMEREGGAFRHTADEQADPESLDVTGGATVDQEGLANNYAIEPEMYVNEPGDLKQEAEPERLNQQEEGKLTEEGDTRGKGTGII